MLPFAASHMSSRHGAALAFYPPDDTKCKENRNNLKEDYIINRQSKRRDLDNTLFYWSVVSEEK
jgi:hypothetical protein